MGTPNHPSRASLVPGSIAGQKPTANPRGSAVAQAKAKRSVSECMRTAMPDEEFTRILLGIIAGKDPFAKARKANPDGVPQLGGADEPIDWHIRMAALKMYAEYSRGKPAQSVIIQAEIDQRIALEGRVEVGPIDFRSMTEEQRHAFRTAASLALGKPAPAPRVQAALRAPIDATAVEVRQPAEPRAQGTPDAHEGDVGGAPRAAGANVSLDDLLAEDEDGTEFAGGGVAGVEPVVHAPNMDPVAADVEADLSRMTGMHLAFRGSSNLFDAHLGDDGILTVRFRSAGAGSAPAPKAYRYRNVTEAMMREWGDAPSAGAWFQRQIRVRHMQYPLIKDATPALPRPIPVVV